MFYIQYFITILTIVLIPLMLRLGKTRDLRYVTYGVFGALILCDAVLYLFCGNNPTYFYLGIVTLLSLFLVRKHQ